MAHASASYQGSDPIEAMILRERLRIVDVHPHKELDLLAIVLNSGDVLQARISDFDRLKKATASLPRSVVRIPALGLFPSASYSQASGQATTFVHLT